MRGSKGPKRYMHSLYERFWDPTIYRYSLGKSFLGPKRCRYSLYETFWG